MPGMALLVAGLAACSTPFKAEFSRFEAQLPAPQGESFAVVADDPALAGGLEFAQYADQVEAAMEKIGYTQATPETATLLVRFDYGVDDGRERVRSTGRSEERRGGKECVRTCRSRWSPYHYKHNTNRIHKCINQKT